MLLQGNSPILLTGNGSCASSFCLYFSLSEAWASEPSPCLSVSDYDVQGGGTFVHMALSLHLPQTGCCAFLWGFEALSLYWLISSSISWPPSVQVPFLFHSSLSGVLIPSRPDFFLFFFSLSHFFPWFYQVMWRYSCPICKSEGNI